MGGRKEGGRREGGREKGRREGGGREREREDFVHVPPKDVVS